ncbi:FAD-dependent monooxygenase [Chitinasiproducens palmae]|uniref:Salicylate hydroxylase n=1 Tax=Chitinasiproducens palmae TaxID=1770053 RepID=A0A1H2PW54_9BURK|nr:FAD-dependent monooxygenase [Chitinasiproducens palmae]SDV51212.1 salicylate hydroxylase [Chitinasiproducens palmae]
MGTANSRGSVGIVGGGIGGLAAAIALGQQGFEVTVLEQAERFGRVGADINLTPNAVRALDGLGVGDSLREKGARPTYRISRLWDSGAETSRLEMSDAAERQYGAPQLTLHRADLVAALDGRLPPGVVRFGQRVRAIDQDGDAAFVETQDGQRHRFDVVIGADGIHSQVRAAMFGPDAPRFTGVVAYRAVVPVERVQVPNTDAFTKWWGPTPESQIVTFPLNRGRDIFIFATTAQDDWRDESWTLPGDVAELRAVYAAFHPEARALLDACDTVLKTALYERDPMPVISQGRLTLLGDACHPMMPFMAQGAGMAIEDAVVLARAIGAADGATGMSEALQRYQAVRTPRTARIQIGSRGNAWLREGGNADWVYGYDAWQTPLDTAPAAAVA